MRLAPGLRERGDQVVRSGCRRPPGLAEQTAGHGQQSQVREKDPLSPDRERRAHAGGLASRIEPVDGDPNGASRLERRSLPADPQMDWLGADQRLRGLLRAAAVPAERLGPPVSQRVGIGRVEGDLEVICHAPTLAITSDTSREQPWTTYLRVAWEGGTFRPPPRTVGSHQRDLIGWPDCRVSCRGRCRCDGPPRVREAVSYAASLGSHSWRSALSPRSRSVSRAPS